MIKSRGVLIAGNWKMNHSLQETESFFSRLQEQASTSLSAKDLKLFSEELLQACVFPPFLSLQEALKKASRFSFPLAVGAQNAHWEKKGAFTGEISGPMLQDIGVRWVLVGHSERRQYFGETNATVQKRAESLLEQGFQVILCIGETLAERQKNQTIQVLTTQINEAIPNPDQGIAQYLNGQVILAYEPVWAIGTGLTATPEQAEEAHEVIRKLLRERFGEPASSQTPILYGGSVTPENIDSLLACSNVDGALVGGASLKPDSFFKLLQAGAKILAN